MVLNKYRSSVDPVMEPIAKKMQGVDPNLISWLAFLFAVLAGYLFIVAGDGQHYLLLLAFLAIILNSVLDALDGYVARYTGKASRMGDFLDHVLDRYADAFIFGGIALSAYCHFSVGLVAIFGVIFTSYMGTQAQAIGLSRNYGGILGRADRLALLLIFTLLQWFYFDITGDVHIAHLVIWGEAYNVTVIEAFMIMVAIGGNLTAIQRGTAAWKDLKAMDTAGTLEAPESPQGVTVETVEVVDEPEPDPTEGDAGKDDVGDADDAQRSDADAGDGTEGEDGEGED
jgi:archaetidylinositol phosphate synthase